MRKVPFARELGELIDAISRADTVEDIHAFFYDFDLASGWSWETLEVTNTGGGGSKRTACANGGFPFFNFVSYTKWVPNGSNWDVSGNADASGTNVARSITPDALNNANGKRWGVLMHISPGSPDDVLNPPNEEALEFGIASRITWSLALRVTFDFDGDTGLQAFLGLEVQTP